jgi:hypothetical protein
MRKYALVKELSKCDEDKKIIYDLLNVLGVPFKVLIKLIIITIIK